MAMQRTDGTYPLDDLDDYTVAEGDPDPRGWDVYSSDNQKLGEVKDLLVDPQAMLVRYLDVELDKDVVSERGRHVLFPVGTARLNDDEDRVTVQSIAAGVRTLPAYQKDGALKREYEDSLLASMGSGAALVGSAGRNDPQDYYQRPEFDTASFYGSRSTRGSQETRRERISGKEGEQHLPMADEGRRMGSASGAKGLGDRIADTVDDLKDRVDGNPASKPGRDATDRPER